MMEHTGFLQFSVEIFMIFTEVVWVSNIYNVEFFLITAISHSSLQSPVKSAGRLESLNSKAEISNITL